MENVQATASDSPFIQGRNARLYGKPQSDCPYPEGSQDRAAWMEAYEEAALTNPPREES
ncbi:Rmf/CrpP family protein [Methylobacterium sp. NEAU 140]|uniref:ribosome modulation factor n=1 Tax=Methylobacterium sp. NEAU 140 TaxID=3064945 RepID=UPI002733EE0B|nr:Rmf/CrpP family protein [Methylobacterium sp. NEAU 140]MDP4025079.1 Rmf/CrpP family protein [Methylobacterium sp. NEAU 140]